MLAALTPARQQGRFFATHDPRRSAQAMAALDAVNARWGRGTLRPASTGFDRSWGAKQQKLSPRYTTRATEMLVATAF